ncbi:U-box domain-containing protein 27-like [Humulus lupulus]|uniref:U-box domain-containing protein 27-like n=1 Tax=Humulus lupulus TaxID=3486 RepID=UPI002B415AE8|nr:U-box domain-containing protein 27-like [Humulus lupulus]
MVRDDLYITVPSFFRCPISLDVMKSPVSLSTGVTYDRSSIQRWFDNGNNTCPATMQVLQSKELVPNRTLQRLIQIWSESVQHRVDSAESSPKPCLTKSQVTELIQRADREADSSVDFLSKIVCFARESDENRKFLAGADGFVPMLVEFLCNASAGASRVIDFLELVVRAMDMIRNDVKDMEKLRKSMLKSDRDCLRSLVLVLQQGSVESRIGSARVLESIAIDAESKLIIAEKEELLSELLKLISPEKDPNLIEAGLSCLIAISKPRRVKVKLVQLGAVKSLAKSLSEPNLSVSVTEKVLKLLETASSVKEGWSEIGGDSNCVARIVQRLLKVSSAATEHAVTVLWSVCYLYRERAAQEAVAKANGVTKILLLMQSNCSPAVRQMSADLLKIFRLSSKSFISCYDTKTTHIMPF